MKRKVEKKDENPTNALHLNEVTVLLQNWEGTLLLPTCLIITVNKEEIQTNKVVGYQASRN